MERFKYFFHKYKHIWILSYAFIYLPWFFYLERHVVGDYYVIHTRIDDWIPFNEYFIIPYLLWFLYVAGAVLYFFFKNKHDYYRLCTYLFTGMSICLFICTIFPNGTDLRPVVDPNKNFCSWLVSLVHAADTSTNIFPSIHVFNSICVHIAIMKSESLRKHPVILHGSLILAILICMATVFLKQHSIVDVAGAGLLAYALYPLVYGTQNASDDETQEVVQKAVS